MIRKGSLILNNAIFRRKTPEPEDSSEFSEEKKTLIDIIMSTEKIKKFIQMILQYDNNNYGVKIRFCAAVIEYEKMIGTDIEHKMKHSLINLFLRDDSMFKINTCHKDLIKIKNEVIDDMLKDSEILKILNILKDHS